MGANTSKLHKAKRLLNSNDSNDQIHKATSEESSSNTGNLFNKGLFMHKKNRASSLMLEDQKSHSSSTLASGATDYDTYNILDHEHDYNCDNAVINAAAFRVNERYEQEKAAILQGHPSCTPCIISQHPATNMKNLDDDANSIYTGSTTITHPPPPPPPPPPESSSASPTTTHKRKSSQYSDWLQSGGTSTIRKKVTSQEVILDLFLQPNGEVDRRKEKDRQQRLHYLLKRIWHGIYRADLKDPSVIVNWCCGIGLWDMEMATLFPDAKVIGVDYKEAALSNLLHGLPNLEFRFAVIHDTFTGLESFHDNSVDFVILRDTWLMNAPVWKWENLLKAIYRILKPGGWIEIEEHSLGIESNGPSSKKLHAWFDVFFNEIQVDRNFARKLGGYLVRAGFIDINKQSIAIPIGEWCSTEYLRETGFLFKDLIERRIRVLAKWVCQLNNIEMKEMNETITTAMDEEVDSYHPCIDWLSYTARKATTTATDDVFTSPAATTVKKEKHPFSPLRIDSSSNTTPPPPSPPPPSVI